MRFCAVGVTLALASASALAYSQDFTPVPMREYRPYSMLFLRFSPEPYPLSAGQARLDLRLLAANSVNLYPYSIVNPIAKEAIEADRFELRYSRGIGKGWELAAEIPVEDLGSGIFDPVITWYHHTFLHLHNIRDQVPYGQHIVFSPAGGPFNGGFGIGDTSLFVSKTTGPSTFVTGGLKLPTGNVAELIGSGGIDAGISGQTTIRLNRVLGATFNGAVVAQSDATRLKHTRSLVLQGGWGIVYAPNSRDSWIVQENYEESPIVEGVGSLDKIEPSTTYAYRRKISAHQSLLCYFTEDFDMLNPNFPFGANVGPDPVFGIEWSLRL